MAENFHHLLQVNYALNDYKSAVADAAGFVSGKRIRNLKAAEQRLHDVLWDKRESIAAAVRALNP